VRAATSVIWAALILLAPAAEQAFAKSEVRFLHAVPGGPSALLDVGGTKTGAAGFGQASNYAPAPGAKVRLKLVAGGKSLASRSVNLASGSYTVVAFPKGSKVSLPLFRDGKGEGGKARLRAIHAAPELDEATFTLDGRRLGTLSAGEAGSYVTPDPGSYTLKVARPGGGGDALLEQEITVSAGVTQTAVAVGSGGEPTRVVVLPDGANAPKKGPATGLGGLSDDGTPWGFALLAALAAGLLGLAAFALASRRGAHGG
jgi:uncharacterized protein DUF4397